ncbi:MAG: 2-amino-4-hydroxy-6-hydroxymethyldihydropteridine diphosphokinase [Ignavibacteria bacterium]
MKNNIFLGLGSNIDDRVLHLNTATSLIGSCVDIKIVKSSLIYETEPWGIRNQNAFCNQVLMLQSSLSPEDLLTFVKEVEVKSGRTQRDKWLEREIDVDILFYDNEVISTERFSLPHKEVQNRKFVLIPMCEIAEAFMHPVLNKSMRQLLNETKDISEVKLYK